jgi:plasmid stabilization system protein ParE
VTRLRWTRRAAEQLMEIRELRLRREVLRAVRGLRQFPRKGRVLPELEDYPDLDIPREARELIFPELARLLYRYDAAHDTILILGMSFRGQDVTREHLMRLLQD